MVGIVETFALVVDLDRTVVVFLRTVAGVDDQMHAWPLYAAHRCACAIVGHLDRNRIVASLWVVVCVGFLSLPVSVYGETSDEKNQFFETQVRPPLLKHCAKCHGAKEQNGELRVDSLAALLKGGDRGPAIVPGKAGQSLLIRAIRHDDEDLQMPPEGKRLDKQTIAALVKWINDGAAWPKGDVASASSSPIDRLEEIRASHWAFQPITRPEPPAVHNTAWMRNAVDRFVLARLEAAGLTPSPRADRRTLIRRAYFDLLGLPPTYEEVEAFVGDPSEDAYALLIERLLARPEYGQRWGRHWLDVARYSDTKGYIRARVYDPRYAYAWTYRDYVVRAFNEDLPYDEFILQQLAADRLERPETERRHLAAMGFLTVGRRFFNRRQHIIPERIDLVSRGLMGMTMMCAQCHDHKFDPLSTKDYYALYGIFDSSYEPGFASLPLLDQSTSTDRKRVAAFEKVFAEQFQTFQQKRRELIENELRSFASEYLVRVVEQMPRYRPPKPLSRKTRRTVLRDNGVELWKRAVQQRPDHPVFRVWHQLAALERDEFAERAPEIIAASEGVNPVVHETLSKKPPKSLIDVARTIGKALEGVQTRWKEQQKEKPASTGLKDPADEELRLVLYGDDSPAVAFSERQARRWYIGAVPGALRGLHSAMEQTVLKYIDVAPPRAMTLEDGITPHDSPIHIRGNYRNRGPVVPRRFIQVLSRSGDDQRFTQGSGRLELARAIVHPDNPLTPRVMVNRVWGWHFGQHLVATPSNFGTRGKPPTHPLLLDYLAWRLKTFGWSIKNLHRLIMTSATYQQSTANREQGRALDPQNELLWRMNRRRLEFEPMRDAMLLAAGELNTGLDALPFRDIDTPRRSVYFYINRRRIDTVLPTFDVSVPEATLPKRDQTTVPQQALYLMNSGFTMRRARKLVDRLDTAVSDDPRQRVVQLYRWIYGRDPSPDELAIGIGYATSDSVDQPASLRANVAETSWRYGYGRHDPETHRVVSFAELPHFNGTRWQETPDSHEVTKQSAYLSASGGRPGRDSNHSVIRRWTAPPNPTGLYRVKGQVKPIAYATAGDGYDVWVVSSRNGLLKHFPVDGSKVVDVGIERINIESGEHIDFIVSCRGSNNFDEFTWSPVVSRIREEPSGNFIDLETWPASAAFQRSVPRWLGALTPWQQYAQILLIANEFMFVD